MSHLSEPMIRLLLPKWQMPLLNLWLRWKSSYHNPSLLQDQAQEFHAWMTMKRNFTLEWPRCSDQCNLEMCHELYYYWCWFCDISSSVVVTVTWYLYLCFVVLFTFTSCSLHCQLFIFQCLYTVVIQCHFSLMRDLTVHYHTWLCSGAFY